MPISASFFSYKGGAGRTTSALNTAYYLIKEVLFPTRNNPLVIIDADTESAGISYLLTKDMNMVFGTEQSLQGLCENAKRNPMFFLPDNGAATSPFLAGYTSIYNTFIPVGEQFEPDLDPESVLLLRSNVQYGTMTTDQYVDYIKELARIVNTVCQCPIIFDTPSGTQALTRGVLRLSRTIVCHMRPTSQFQEGTKDYLQRYLETTEGYQKNIILCPSVVPLAPVTIDGDQYPDTYYNRLSAFVDEVTELANNGLEINVIDFMTEQTKDEFYLKDFADDLREYHQNQVVGIPEIPRFKWREGLLPVIKDLSTEEKLACERYRYLANIIAGRVE